MTAADHRRIVFNRENTIRLIDELIGQADKVTADEFARRALPLLFFSSETLSEHAAELARAQQEIETWRDRYREEHENKLRLWNLSTQDMFTVFGLRRKAVLRAWQYRRDLVEARAEIVELRGLVDLYRPFAQREYDALAAAQEPPAEEGEVRRG